MVLKRPQRFHIGYRHRAGQRREELFARLLADRNDDIRNILHSQGIDGHRGRTRFERLVPADRYAEGRMSLCFYRLRLYPTARIAFGIIHANGPIAVHGRYRDNPFDTAVIRKNRDLLRVGIERGRQYLPLLHHTHGPRSYIVQTGGNDDVPRTLVGFRIIAHRYGNSVAVGSHRNPLLGGIFRSCRPCQFRIADRNGDTLRLRTLSRKGEGFGTDRDGTARLHSFTGLLLHGDADGFDFDMVHRLDGYRTGTFLGRRVIGHGDEQRFPVLAQRGGEPLLRRPRHFVRPLGIRCRDGDALAAIARCGELQQRGLHRKRCSRIHRLLSAGDRCNGKRKEHHPQRINFFHLLQ